MADTTVYIGEGADTESVVAAVRASTDLIDWDVEDVDDYPGYSVAVDIYGGSAENVEKRARELAATLAGKLPWAVTTQEQLEQAAPRSA